MQKWQKGDAVSIMKLDYDVFEVEYDEKENNKVKSIRLLNALSNKKEDFIAITAIFRFFIHRHGLDTNINLTENKNETNISMPTIYPVRLKYELHWGTIYLEVETLESYTYEAYDNRKISLDFTPQKKQVPEIEVQIWLESLNKCRLL